MGKLSSQNDWGRYGWRLTSQGLAGNLECGVGGDLGPSPGLPVLQELPGACHFASLSLHFLICKTGPVMIATAYCACSVGTLHVIMLLNPVIISALQRKQKTEITCLC